MNINLTLSVYSTNKVEGIASLVFRQHTFIFVLTEDSMIRVFDMPSKACVLEYHIDAEQWDTSAPAENKTSVTKRRLKLLPLEKDDTDENGDPVQRFKLFVYVGSDAGESTVRFPKALLLIYHGSLTLILLFSLSPFQVKLIARLGFT